MNYITTTKGPPSTRCAKEETPESENRVSTIFTKLQGNSQNQTRSIKKEKQ